MGLPNTPQFSHPDAYKAGAVFRCRRGHDTFGRDEALVVQGLIYCPRCGTGDTPDLEYLGRVGGIDL